MIPMDFLINIMAWICIALCVGVIAACPFSNRLNGTNRPR
jgi:hypothetical protein